MLRELQDVAQVQGEPYRQWFRDRDLDLIVWRNEPDGMMVGFQLCYREDAVEKALTWTRQSGYSHRRVDEGESRPDRHKMTPLLVYDGTCNGSLLKDRFAQAAAELPQSLRDDIQHRLDEYIDSRLATLETGC